MTRRAPFRHWTDWTAVCPFQPGRAERHGFEYYRHGTLSLYAALNPQTGEVIGQTTPRHTSQEFVTFLEEVVAAQSPLLSSSCAVQQGSPDDVPAVAVRNQMIILAIRLQLGDESGKALRTRSPRALLQQTRNASPDWAGLMRSYSALAVFPKLKEAILRRLASQGDTPQDWDEALIEFSSHLGHTELEEACRASQSGPSVPCESLHALEPAWIAENAAGPVAREVLETARSGQGVANGHLRPGGLSLNFSTTKRP